ncbi:MAG TPA: DUF2059 domain-containing protein [Terracidiphilus sp.]|nr:DUF2059 domain-containing protein [Terracidiphilus sp.]
MQRAHWMAAAIGIGVAMAALPVFGQAYTVGPSGTVAQEKPDSVLAIPAADQATKEQLGKLFAAMKIQEQVQSMRQLVPAMVEGQIRDQSKSLTTQSGSHLTPEQRAAMDKLTHKFLEKAINIYTVDEMVNDMTSIYQRYLTREDVDGMIAFYSSPAGQHLLEAQPKIARDFMPVVMGRITERTRLLTAEMMKEAAEITQAPKSTAPEK